MVDFLPKINIIKLCVTNKILNQNRKEYKMEKKKFTLHVSFVYAISECTNFSETDVEFFEDSSGAC